MRGKRAEKEGQSERERREGGYLHERRKEREGGERINGGGVRERQGEKNARPAVLNT